MTRESLSFRNMALGAVVIAAGIAGRSYGADPGKLTIQADKPGAKISPSLYGLMTEEINYSYDGGLYGELIQNRIFVNPVGGGRGRGAPPADAAPGGAPVVPHWSVVNSEGAAGTMALDTMDPVNTAALTTSLKLTIAQVGTGQRVGVANDGYWGIPVKAGTTYQASFYAKAAGGFSGPLTVTIESPDGKTAYATGTVPALTEKWQPYKVELKTGEVAPTTGQFVISGAAKGTVNFNLVSLFPPTFHNRANGNRVDIMQLLDDMHPAFLRFPGGNYVEGQDYANRWNWKATLGPLEERAGHMSPWRYRSTDGMGLLEYLEWCEDLKMEPVLAVFAGYTLNRQSYPGEYGKFAQEAVDEIEYVTGDVSTPWGAERAKDGHPASFKLTYVEVGNEDPGGANSTYAQRFPLFYLAIKAKYPNIQVISTTRNNFGLYTPDVIDEHYYMNFYSAQMNAHMYDNRPRNAPKIFVGEWATRDNRPTPTYQSALSDAAFLTGLERNADIIVMSCYAPLFVNVNPGGQQWATDLIGYNTLNSFGSPSYYVQKLFNNNRGDLVLPISELTPQTVPPPLPAPARRGGGAATGPAAQPAAVFASATKDDATGDVILKFVNPRDVVQRMEISFAGAASVDGQAGGWIMEGDPAAVNSIGEPALVSPKPLTVNDAGVKFTHEFPANSVTVLRFKVK